jgi:hypothetical protein
METIGNGNKVFKKTIGLEFGKQEFRISSGIQKKEGLVLVERSTPSNMKKEMAGGAGAGIVEAWAPNDRERERDRERESILSGVAQDERT